MVSSMRIVLAQLTVQKLARPLRFREYAAEHFAHIFTKKGVRKAIDRGDFLLDGKPARTGDLVHEGQSILLFEQEPVLAKVFPLEIPVIFEDEHLAVVNKPAGYPVSGNRYKTIEHALPHNLKPTELPDSFPAPRPVHRLDSATSGLLIVAKTRSAAAELGRMFESREIQKTYHALVAGALEKSGSIDVPIDGLDARTDFTVIDCSKSLKYENLSLVECKPLTGRTHQIRKHMASLGHPIIGDPLYSEDVPLLKGKGLFLSAVGLRFNHPISGENLVFSIEHPAKFDSYRKREERRLPVS
jgi:23S rRNA pseudouridine1911/1915/1917 synthase